MKPAGGGLLTGPQLRYLGGSEEGRAFLAALDARVGTLAEDLGLTVIGPAGPGATSVALAAEDRSGTPLVLKLDPDVRRAASAASALSAWSARGVAPAVRRSGEGWYLMDAVAGTSVPRPLPEGCAAAAAAAAESLRVAWATPVAAEVLFDRMSWLLPLTRRRLVEAGHPRIRPQAAVEAERMLRDLREGVERGACHGDPVGGNMLLEAGKVKLIDPVPHHDPLEAVAGHWAARARDGSDAPALLREVWPDVDRGRAEGWIAINALTFAAYLLSTGRTVSTDLEGLLKPFVRHQQG